MCAAQVFGGIFLSQNSDKRFYTIFGIVCAVVLALVLALTLIKPSFFTGSSSSSSEASSGEEDSSSTASDVVSTYGAVADFDYENFTYSDSLDENGYWTGIRALDYVTLPDDYAAIPVSKDNIDPSDDDVQTQIDSLLTQSATETQVTDREAADGDSVNIDFSGSVDGVAFTGGTSTGYDLTLGSGSFIDGFEDQIIGHTPGETFDVTVTFPDGYSDSTDSEGNTVVLAGQEAVFSVTLNYITETTTPELTDTWVDETYGESDDLHTVEALQTRIYDMLYENNLQTYIMEYLLAKSTFTELPKTVTDYQVLQCLNYYYSMAAYYNYDLDSFVTDIMGYDSTDAMLAQMDDNIESYSKEALIYQAVAEALDIAPTQDQIDTYSDYVDTYGQNYCTMVAMMDAVSETLIANAQVS